MIFYSGSLKNCRERSKCNFIKFQNCHRLLIHVGYDSNRREIDDVKAYFYCSDSIIDWPSSKQRHMGLFRSQIVSIVSVINSLAKKSQSQAMSIFSRKNSIVSLDYHLLGGWWMVYSLIIISCHSPITLKNMWVASSLLETWIVGAFYIKWSFIDEVDGSFIFCISLIKIYQSVFNYYLNISVLSIAMLSTHRIPRSPRAPVSVVFSCKVDRISYVCLTWCRCRCLIEMYP